MIEVDYERTLNETELAWVRRLIGRLESGELDWPATLRQDLLSQVLGEP